MTEPGTPNALPRELAALQTILVRDRDARGVGDPAPLVRAHAPSPGGRRDQQPPDRAAPWIARWVRVHRSALAGLERSPHRRRRARRDAAAHRRELGRPGHDAGARSHAGVFGLNPEQAQAVYRICQAQDQAWREKRRVREMEELRARSGGVHRRRSRPDRSAAPPAIRCSGSSRRAGCSRRS